jgi:hypothetical protein
MANQTWRNRTAEPSQQEDLPASLEGKYDWPQDQPTERGNESQASDTTQMSLLQLDEAHRWQTEREETAVEPSQQEDLPASLEGEYDWPQKQPTEWGNESQASDMTQMSLLQLDEAKDPQIQNKPHDKRPTPRQGNWPKWNIELKAMFVSAFATFNSNFITLDSKFATLETSNKEL